MAQGYDKYELDNQTGQSFRFALNDILEAAATQNSGDNSPNTTNTSYPYQVWVDTTNDIVKIRDAATAGSWYSLYSVDSDGKPTGAVAYGNYTIATNDTAGNGGTTAITVDTSQRVGIGTGSPNYEVSVNASDSSCVLQLTNTTTGSTAGDGLLTYITGNDAIISNEEAGYLEFKTSGTQRLHITSGGNVGIGEPSPSAGLHVVKDVNPVLKLDRGTASTANANWYYNGTLTGQVSAANADFQVSAAGASTPISFYANGSMRMQLDTAGRINLEQGKSIAWRYQTNSTARGKIVVESTDTFYFYQGASDIERFSFNTSGNFFFNPTGVQGRLFLNTTNANRSFGETSAGTGSAAVYIGNAQVQVSSDERIKENIQDTQLDALAAVKQISVKDFTWNDPKDTSHNNRNARGTWTGVIAQELVEILPFVVNAPRNKDDLEIDHDSEEIWTLDQSQLCPVLIKAMQQQQAMIETLQAKVAALESA